MMLEAFLVSTATVAVAEMGDKTQLLAIVLAARFRQPLAVVAGILAATLLNHALAAMLGTLVAQYVPEHLLRWLLAAGFFATAIWALFPDKEEDGPAAGGKWGAFAATTIAFFVVEMGDKTQIATIALAARFEAPLAVTLGTTAGMMLANVPAVIFADRLLKILPLKLLRLAAAVIFAALGVGTLLA
jgi:putative Ca2+/H+ antiporter (TMEM165/GDT1 family)